MPVISVTVSGFSQHVHQTRVLLALGLGTLYYNNTIVIYSKWCRVAGRTHRLINTESSSVLKMLPSACGLGQHFQDLGHSFSLYGPPSRQITYISSRHRVISSISTMYCNLAVIDCYI